MIGKAELIASLYILDVISGIIDFGVHVAIVAHVSKTTWHNRLGNLSFKRLDSIKPQLQFHDIDPDFCFVVPWLNKGDYPLYIIIIFHKMLLI